WKRSSWLDVDPRRIRFAHSRIRPVFSGCGRTLNATIEEVKTGQTSLSDIPTITVIEGPKKEKNDNRTADEDVDDGGRRRGRGRKAPAENNDEPWFFSLNNRRLYVFKELRDMGLLPCNTVRVRARAPKPHECKRYTLERCAERATVMGGGSGGDGGGGGCDGFGDSGQRD
ncbi:unnamed protein product, partial [Phaeothamnion confervicola]